MITQDQYKSAVRRFYKSKPLISDWDKLYILQADDNFEMTSYYLDKRHAGLLFIELDELQYVASFSRTSLKPDKTGRIKPVICDVCYTRLPGTKISLVSFVKSKDGHVFSWLICSDLRCSMHTRELTPESRESKKILGETVSVEQKIKRLGNHLKKMVDVLALQPIGAEK